MKQNDLVPPETPFSGRRMVVYPEAWECLQQSGLADKIVSRKTKQGEPNILSSYLFEDDVDGLINSLWRDGYYQQLSTDEHAILKRLTHDQKTAWVVPHTADQEPLREWDTALLLSGYYASWLLEPKDFANHEQWGFSSFFAFTGTVGAAVLEHALANRSRPEHWRWVSEHPDGTEWTKELGMDPDGVHLSFIDTTPYYAKDPLNNPVPYRPIDKKDDRRAYITRPIELVTLMLRYHDEIPQGSLLKNNTSLFWSLVDEEKPTAFELPPDILEKMHHHLHRLNSKGRTYNRYQPQFFNSYAYIGQQDELVIADQHAYLETVQPRMVLVPEDVDHILKGMLYTAPRSGRSLDEVLEPVAYRFSEEFLLR